jgi:dipeptidyl aminopeptidase/acylaminoacyl peptidase
VAETAPYGSWSSPIDARAVAESGKRVANATLAEDGAVWWAEGRPTEGGRVVLVRRAPGGEPEDVTPEGYYVRTRVHEYGGGPWTLSGADEVLFSNMEDQRLYRQRLGERPVALTPEPAAPAALRYADGRPTPDGRRLVCVREAHAGDGEPVNEVVAVPLDGAGEPAPVATGRDFYSSPRPSPDGSRLAWLCWDHPNMPWDGTELWVAPSDDPAAAVLVAGGPSESVFQPEWSPDGILHFVSDRGGWWNLHRLAGGSVEQLTEEEAELGHPQWLFGGATYAFLPGGAIACVRCAGGEERLAVLGPGAGSLEDLGLPYTSFGFPALSSRGGLLAFAAAGVDRGAEVAVVDVAAGTTEVVARAEEEAVDPAFVSVPRAIEFPTGGGEAAHGFYYPPANAGYEGPAGELPPLIVQSHGGPTSHATPALDRELLFWTSRGFGVVDVNYRGSSGFGRAYRDRLKGDWGVVDTEDCIAAARHLAESGEADGSRLAIRGGSAGGYATLCALVFHDDFAAGASYYGVADTETLARDTHKFESRYLDSLIGPYPERADLYRERSPIHRVDQLRAPVILFQGLEDEIVPPDQAETMAAALARNGVPHALLMFEGEQHGFRRAETNVRCLEAELYFYGRIFGFEPADELEPVAISAGAP